MFKSHRESTPSDPKGNISKPDIVWFERFRNVSKVEATPGFQEGKGSSFILNIELSGTVSEKGVSTPAETEVRHILIVQVDERDAPTLLRLLGKRVLLRELRSRDSLEQETLEAEIVTLRKMVEELSHENSVLRSNHIALVEGTRRSA